VGRLLPRRTRLLLAAVLLLGLALLPAWLYRQVRAHVHDQPTRPADVIIVLGSGGPKAVSRVYAARLDHALSLHRRGLAPAIIVTEQAPVAQHARDYLLGAGVPPEDILLEDHSRTTWENLWYAREVMSAHGWRSAIIASCGFHLYRALEQADELGIEAQGAAAPDSPIEASPGRRARSSRLEVWKLLVHPWEPTPG